MPTAAEIDMFAAIKAAYASQVVAVKAAFNSKIPAIDAANARLNATMAAGSTPELVAVANSSLTMVNALNRYGPLIKDPFATLNALIPDGPAELVNVALNAAATASSVMPGYQPAGAIDGDSKGVKFWNNGGGRNKFPDWLQVDFARDAISEIDVFMVQDEYQTPVEPTEELTFTKYGLTAFQVQHWDGSAWQDAPGGNVTGNDKVWRKFTFPPITTERIRVLTNASPDGYSRVAEVKAWGPGAPPVSGPEAVNERTGVVYPGIDGVSKAIDEAKGDDVIDAPPGTHRLDLAYPDDRPANASVEMEFPQRVKVKVKRA